MGFIIKYEQAETTSTPFTKQKFEAVFAALLAGKTVTEAKHTAFVKSTRVAHVQSMLEAITATMVEVAKKSSPDTITKMKTAVIDALSKHYDIKTMLYDADKVTDAQASIRTVIDEVVKRSNLAGNATYGWWLTQTKGDDVSG